MLPDDRNLAAGASGGNMASAPFHLMTKPVGSKCNLDCTYCFYLEKENLYPAGHNFKMSPTVLEAYVRDYIAAQPGPIVSFAWQGGEPTLAGLEFFRRAVALQEQYRGDKIIENALQTNGTLLDDDWGAFLAHHRFLVGISIDGPAHLHDPYRVDREGRGSLKSVLAGLAVLKKHGVQFNTLTTVHRKNSRQPLEVYRFLRNLGSGFMQFIPIVERDAEASAAETTGLWLAEPPRVGNPEVADQRVTEWSVLPADYGRFLCTIFDEWVSTATFEMPPWCS